MKKIIAVFDGLKFSESTKEYASVLAKNSNTHLVGVFLEDFTYHSYQYADIAGREGISVKKQKAFDAKDSAARKNAVKNFEKYCQHAKLDYAIHHDRLVALPQLLQESIYSDLLIIDTNETLTHYKEPPPTRFIKDLLAETHCPVLLVPEKYKPVEKIIMLYYGEPSSVYAIKMFSYLMHAFMHIPAELVTIKSPYRSLHLPDGKLMREFMKRHYPKAAFKIFKGNAHEEVTEYLKHQDENVLVVLGAYQRGWVSRLLKESMADTIVKQCKVPLFIAHISS